MTDTHALWRARTILRTAYHALAALRSEEPTIRVTITELDDRCVELSGEIMDALAEQEPELALHRAA